MTRLVIALCALLFGANAATAQQPGVPGQFDYYVLSLSWSPSFCAKHPDARPQCAPAQTRGFVLHGLWPQYEAGGWPAACPGDKGVPADVTRRMLDSMPSKGLVSHEWKTHGVCSGLTPDDYFAQAEKAFRAIRLPPILSAPRQPLNIATQDLVRLFTQENPGLPAASVAPLCQGRDIAEVRICLDKSLRPRPCAQPTPSRCQGERGRLPPVE